MRFYHLALLGLGFISSVNAADITIFYSPSCPHCHHARDFIKNELVYEYNDLTVTEINATLVEHRGDFINALNKCKYTSGGVPVLVIGDKCFQGYGVALNDEIRAAIEVDYNDAQKESVKSNQSDLAADRDAFVAAHKSRQNAIINQDENVKKN